MKTHEYKIIERHEWPHYLIVEVNDKRYKIVARTVKLDCWKGYEAYVEGKRWSVAEAGKFSTLINKLGNA